jgi:DNA invertase Pin-like site-specific DNA recombinase
MPKQERRPATVREVRAKAVRDYQAKIQKRASEGKAAKRAEGGYVGGRPPFGWRAEKGELVPDESEQAVIKLAKRLSDEGLSSRKIAARLGELGHRTKTGGFWSSAQVVRLLRSD